MKLTKQAVQKLFESKLQKLENEFQKKLAEFTADREKQLHEEIVDARKELKELKSVRKFTVADARDKANANRWYGRAWSVLSDIEKIEKALRLLELVDSDTVDATSVQRIVGTTLEEVL